LASETSHERRRRLTHRALPVLALVALGALGIGLAMGSGRDSGAERVGRSFATAWQRSDYRQMHSLLTAAAQKRYPLAVFRRAYEQAAATATATAVLPGKVRGAGSGAVRIPVVVRTTVFGNVRATLKLPVAGGAVDWSPELAFPGVVRGEQLVRKSDAPPRGTIVSVDNKVLAQGPAAARTSPLGGLASSIAGTLEPGQDAASRMAVYARGFAPGTPVGKTGLERALEGEVQGRPGGTLLAGRRVVARARPRPAGRVRSTIDTRLQQSAVTALGGQLGGVAALDPRTGSVRALAGIAFSAPQPPGSTFKIVTATAALDAGLVKPTDKFSVKTKAVIDGVDLENANGESCGGTFAESFAHSCNSVFAPLGIKVGPKRLVATAEKFGWNENPGLPGAQPSTLPAAGGIKSPLEIGSASIGQFTVLATPLQMASVAQTIANGGVRLRPTLATRDAKMPVRVTSPKVAGIVENLMLGVVRYGTGTAAQIPGVKVAGKTGTAELGDTRGQDAPGAGGDPSNTDAWFTSYAPADSPRIVVAVLLVRNGSGGATAAPVARQVLGTALGK